ncbi:hypothetical protein LTR66_009522 [Elasticomyces elasticus]|nr:hypothetical protein LTR66_009522 [Elasticomyces elasticus]KAK4987340.1 hypothetical protein LTR50_004675 [Elasticomyces elasticus]
MVGVRGNPTFTLPPGQHEWPFSFKLPFNNSCSFAQNSAPKLSIAGLSLEVARAPAHHVKKTLPPSLTGFPGEAEIRYFVKVTVNRPTIFKENARAYAPFNFLPIEPPRPTRSGSEVYARRRHAFTVSADRPDSKSRMKDLFGRQSTSGPSTPTEAPFIGVDARLPEPAILTCNEDIPLRIIFKRLNEHGEIHVDSLQIQLIGYTHVRAHDVHRTEANGWTIMTKSKLGIPIGSVTDVVGTETVLNNGLWRGKPLPNTVAPSFETCNLSRTYELESQMITLPLRLAVQVYSGIAPPALLLAKMEAAASDSRRSSMPSPAIENNQAPRPIRKQLPPRANTSAGPSSYQTTVAPNQTAAQSFPLQGGGVEPPAYSDAPPSYEDAIAQDLPPIDGPRRHYEPPPAAEDEVLRREEKRGWV